VMFVLLALIGYVCCSVGPYIQIIEWDYINSQNCPNLGNGGDGSVVSIQQAYVYSTHNNTYKKREIFVDASMAEESVNDPLCVIFSIGFGINQYNSSIIPKTGYSIAISFAVGGVTNCTFVEYASATCAIGTATGVVLIRNFLVCYQDTEGGVPVSRWFQITPQIPPGYTVGALGSGPPNFYDVLYYLTNPATSGCGTSVASFRFPNDQKCHKLSDTLYVNGYCGSVVSFSGYYYNDSSCTQQVGNLNSVVVNQCGSDVSPGYATGCVSGICLSAPATKLVIQCSSTALYSTMATTLLVILALVNLF